LTEFGFRCDAAAFAADERLLRQFDSRQYFHALSFAFFPQQKRLGYGFRFIRDTNAVDRLAHERFLARAELYFHDARGEATEESVKS
jgi:hypothetical protein